MRPETAEWVAKAEADFASMQRENSVVQSPNYDLICFLAQQCVEKYLKGLLCEQTISFPRSARNRRLRLPHGRRN
jgi:HEPN domain-containing protein